MSISYDAAKAALDVLRRHGVAFDNAQARGFVDAISVQIDAELHLVAKSDLDGVWLVQVGCEGAGWALDAVEKIGEDAALEGSYRLRLIGLRGEGLDRQKLLALAALREARPMLKAAHYSFTARAAVHAPSSTFADVDLGCVNVRPFLDAWSPRETACRTSWSVITSPGPGWLAPELLEFDSPCTYEQVRDRVLAGMEDSGGGALLWIEASDEQEAARHAYEAALEVEAARRAALESDDCQLTP